MGGKIYLGNAGKSLDDVSNIKWENNWERERERETETECDCVRLLSKSWASMSIR